MFFARLKIYFIIALALVGLGAAVFLYRLKMVKVPLPSNTQSLAKNLHYSYFSQKENFENAYSLAKSQDYNPAVKGILVNHHLLAASFIAESFNTIATTTPVTVLLISPNHFSAGKGDIITSALSWQTPYGVLEPDLAVVNKLSEEGLANIEEDPFVQEHGISGIVAFVKKSLPKAKIVPLIFRDRMTLSQVMSLADSYQHILDADKSAHYITVGSFDFSHYLTSRAADFHDVENLSAVESFNFFEIYNLDIDSRPGLAFFLQLLKNNHEQKFTLLEQSNSAKLAKQDVLETTSYITGYFSVGSAGTSSPDTLLSLGNINTAPQVLSALQKNTPSYALEYMERLFYGQDETMAFLKNGDSKTESALKKLGLSLAVEDNKNYQLGKFKLKIINCAKGINGDKGEEGAKRAIDEGADVAICQGAKKSYVEIYKTHIIIYAAGNFLDEKTILQDGASLAIGLAYENNKLKVFFLPIGGEKGKLKLLVGEESGKVLLDIAKESLVSEEMKKQIENGEIVIDPFDFAQGRQN